MKFEFELLALSASFVRWLKYGEREGDSQISYEVAQLIMDAVCENQPDVVDQYVVFDEFMAVAVPDDETYEGLLEAALFLDKLWEDEDLRDKVTSDADLKKAIRKFFASSDKRKAAKAFIKDSLFPANRKRLGGIKSIEIAYPTLDAIGQGNRDRFGTRLPNVRLPAGADGGAQNNVYAAIPTPTANDIYNSIDDL